MATHVKVIAAGFLFVGVVCALLTLLAPAILTGLAGMIGTSGDPEAVVGATILGLAGLWQVCSSGRSPSPSWSLDGDSSN